LFFGEVDLTQQSSALCFGKAVIASASVNHSRPVSEPGPEACNKKLRQINIPQQKKTTAQQSARRREQVTAFGGLKPRQAFFIIF